MSLLASLDDVVSGPLEIGLVCGQAESLHRRVLALAGRATTSAARRRTAALLALRRAVLPPARPWRPGLSRSTPDGDDRGPDHGRRADRGPGPGRRAALATTFAAALVSALIAALVGAGLGARALGAPAFRRATTALIAVAALVAVAATAAATAATATAVASRRVESGFVAPATALAAALALDPDLRLLAADQAEETAPGLLEDGHVDFVPAPARAQQGFGDGFFHRPALALDCVAHAAATPPVRGAVVWILQVW